MKYLFFRVLVIFFLWKSTVYAQDSLLVGLMQTQPAYFGHILNSPEKYEVQIIYTQIRRDSLNRPFVQTYSYGQDAKSYFNPASLVKLPVTALALEKLNELLIPGVHKFTRMYTDSNYACQKTTTWKELTEDNYPCIGKYIEQMLLVSDNDAYSRLYEFLGQEYIQQKLKDKHYDHVRILRRFDDCDSSQNRHTNPIRFYNPDLRLIYEQPAAYNPSPYDFPFGKISKGKGYLDASWRMIHKPKDVTYNNYLPLQDVHTMLMAVMMPEIVPVKKRFKLTKGDYYFLRKRLGAYPRRGNLTKYTAGNGYYDTYKKYLYYGRKKQSVNPDLHIFNIVGWWEGYLSDCAYFVDFENQIEFFLSAMIYTNKNELFDYRFEYNEVGFPFLEKLGRLIYKYEKKLLKKHKPNLNEYILD